MVGLNILSLLFNKKNIGTKYAYINEIEYKKPKFTIYFATFLFTNCDPDIQQQSAGPYGRLHASDVWHNCWQRKITYVTTKVLKVAKMMFLWNIRSIQSFRKTYIYCLQLQVGLGWRIPHSRIPNLVTPERRKASSCKVRVIVVRF